MSWVKRLFLIRRRFDNHFLSIGAAGLPFRNGITPVVAIVFSVIGLYLVAGRHRSTRYQSRLFLGLAVGYLLWSVGLIVFRGESILDNRQVAYSLLITLLAFCGSGMVLVRKPLRAFVIGSRIGVVLAAIVSVIFQFVWEVRFGMGGNPAPWALIVAICAISAIIPLAGAPRWAPNSKLYLFAGILPVATSETRAVLIPMMVIMLVEAIRWLVAQNTRLRVAGVVLGLAIATGLSFTGPFKSVIHERMIPSVLYAAGYAPEWKDAASDELRPSMWQGAWDVFTQHPVAGLGADRMSEVSERAPGMNETIARFTHVHNIFLDELITQGLVGLLLLMGALLAALWHLARYNRDREIRLNLLWTTTTVLAYGMLHNPFLHETTIAAIFIYIGVLMAQTARNRLALAIRR